MRRVLGVVFVLLICGVAATWGQSTNATLDGRVTDSSGGVIVGATVEIINNATGFRWKTETNRDGIYSVPNLPPGPYHIRVAKDGFKVIVHPDIVLNVQDAKTIAFTMLVGSAAEVVTVEGGASMINTTDAAVSTVVDRQFADNLPLNGRSFQALIQLAPGVVPNANAYDNPGQFNVNGQRASSNYWMVDGVSANFGITPQYAPSGGSGGSLGAFNAIGGTNSLVSVDALQEFRIQTSTYAPEFGRTPGGQISIVTRSGTNQFHGSAFDYFRNTVLDATDWFANASGLPKAAEQQNDFGGTFGGRLIRDKLFFFFSYEGLRLNQPTTTLSTVPDLASRQAALPTVQPFFNAFPLPNPGMPDLAPGIAPFNSSYSNPSKVDATSIRVDYNLAKNLQMFGRYNYSPSVSDVRGEFATSLNSVLAVTSTTQTATVGLTWTASPKVVNEFRFNYSSSGGSTVYFADNFGGAGPLPLTNVLPSGYTLSTSQFGFGISEGTDVLVTAGWQTYNLQHQYNAVDTLSVLTGTHSLKFGADYRALTPYWNPRHDAVFPNFPTVAAAELGETNFTIENSNAAVTFLFQNFSLFGQDTWKINPRLTLTYGLRWDVDFSPQTLNGPALDTVTGFNLNDFSQLALAGPGKSIYKTQFGNFAPRVSIAYQLSQNPNWGTVLRGGFGVFYDLASSEVGNQFWQAYPYAIYLLPATGTFPFAAALPPAPIIPPNATQGTLVVFDPNLNVPYSLQWNFAAEKALGADQTFTISYVGSVGRRLMAKETVTNPNPNYASANIIANGATSSYNALQLQFRRRLARGLQSLISYNWSHSLDDGSYGDYTNGTIADLSANKASSDFDIRQTFSAAVTYQVPVPKMNAFADAILRGWSTDNILQVHSAPNVDVLVGGLYAGLELANSSILVRPDVVPGQPFYLYGPQYPGGKALNPNAFTAPPTNPITGSPLRQGDLGRNAFRAFGLTQWDFAVHRDFPIREALKLQFRAEMFNVFNHPNFAPFDNTFGTDPLFGRSTSLQNQALAGIGGYGGLSALYSLGGPRSIQLALKLIF
jgi:hypothetical protein